MTIMPYKTYRLLKRINKTDMSRGSILNRFGEAAAYRISALSEDGYIEITSGYDTWQAPIEPIIYAITESGKAYLEDYWDYKLSEWLTTMRNGIWFPLVTTLLANGILYLISLYQSQKL